MGELLEATNLILIFGFGIVIFLMWLLIKCCISIADNLIHLLHINDSLHEINHRLRRKGFYKDKNEQNHSQFMDDD